MRTSPRRSVAFALGICTVVAMSGFLLIAAPPQEVGTWQLMGTTPPASARTGAATATLADGRTLIAGGQLGDGGVTDSVVIYDPLTNESTTVGQLLVPRLNAAAARLEDGRVLVAGGEIGELLSADVEIFDPSTGASVGAGVMAAPRTKHAAVRLADGKVLIVGGATVDGVVLASAEVFDPETGSMEAAGSMATPRAGASATLLIDNRVLVVGGNDGTPQALASAELFYPFSNEFYPVDTQLSQARAGHTAVLLPHNGAVLIAGGTAASAAVTTVDLFMPAMFPDPYSWGMGSFAAAAAMNQPRSSAVGGPAGDDGFAFVAGGGMPQAEAYAFVTLKTDKDDYAPGEPALITGSGWLPEEDVELVFQEDPAVHPDYVLTLTADGEGNLSDDEWAPEEHDLNVRFYLMATGKTSGRRAQITFTDSRNLNLTFAGSGGGSVTITPSTGTVNAPVACGGTGTNAASQTVTRTCAPNITTSDNGATVTFAATAASGSVFAGWSAPGSLGSSTCSGTTNPCSAVLGGGPALTVTFNITTTTTVAASPNPSIYGSSAGFTATVRLGAAPVTTGTVTFIEGGTCAAPVTTLFGPVGPPNASGQVLFSTSGLAAGSHTITACYNGAAGFPASSGSVSQTVTKAPTTTTVTCPASVSYTGSPLTACSAVVTGPVGLNEAVTVSYSNNSDVGTATASATYAGSANYLTSSDTKSFAVTAATSVTTVTCPASATYTGSALTPCTANVTGAGGLNQSLTVSYSDNVNAGTATASASFAGDANHNASSDSETFTIDKASSTTTVTCPANVTYTGSPLTPCSATATGAGELNESLTVNYTDNINAGAASATASFAGDANHTGSNDSETFTIDKAPSVTTVSCPANVTYTGSPLTPCSAAATGAGGLAQSLTVNYTDNTNAGTASATASFAGDSNHTGSNDSETFTIDKAPSVTVVTIGVGPFVYNGAPHTPATVSVTGAGGLDLAPPADYLDNIAAGTATASYTFAGDDNHTGSSDSKTFTIEQAPSVTDVSCPAGPYTYTGSAIEPCSVTVTGAGGLDLNPAPNYLHNVNAGTATASYTFAGDANHTGSSDSATFTIDPAASVTTVTCPASVTFTGDAQEVCSATATGVGGLHQSLGVSYLNNVNAGTATANASFAGDANHTGSSDSEHFTIDPAASVTTLTCSASVTYNGSAQEPCSANVTGAGGLNQSLAVTYGNNINAGTATADASYAGDANHTSSSDHETFAIEQASSVTDVTCVAGPFTYNGSAQTPCSVSVTGAGGLSLTPSPAYANNVNAGTASASYTFAGDANHTGSNDSEHFNIGQASSSTTVFCASGPFVFTGSALTPCSATATGAGGLDQSLTVSYADNINAGTATASASFAGDANHTGSSNSETFAIGRASSTTVVSCTAGPFTYNGLAQTPCSVHVTGAGSLSLTPTPNYANNVNAGTATASHNYAGDANHTGSSDSKSFTIDKKSATWTTNPAGKTLGAADPNPLTTGSGAGFLAVDGVSATYGRAVGETVAGSPYPITATLSATGLLSNYQITNNGSAFSILYASTGSCLGSPGHQVLQPLNTDGTSVVKKGSTVPVKFRVCDANGNSIGTAGVVTAFQLVQVINGTAVANVNEDPLSTTPDAAFRWSASDQQWIFNLSTRDLSQGRTYVYKITLNDGSTIDFRFGTKQ